jgi:hypothetical protein
VSRLGRFSVDRAESAGLRLSRIHVDVEESNAVNEVGQDMRETEEISALAASLRRSEMRETWKK